MFKNHRISRAAASLVLILVLGLTLACRLTQDVIETPETIDETIPLPPPTSEASRPEVAPPTIDEPPQVVTSVPTQAVSQPVVWQHNWLHFGVDSQFSSFNPNETQINKENITGLMLLYGSGCDDGVFSVIGGLRPYTTGASSAPLPATT